MKVEKHAATEVNVFRIFLFQTMLVIQGISKVNGIHLIMVCMVSKDFNKQTFKYISAGSRKTNMGYHRQIEIAKGKFLFSPLFCLN